MTARRISSHADKHDPSQDFKSRAEPVATHPNALPTRTCPKYRFPFISYSREVRLCSEVCPDCRKQYVWNCTASKTPFRADAHAGPGGCVHQVITASRTITGTNPPSPEFLQTGTHQGFCSFLIRGPARRNGVHAEYQGRIPG